ncbi:50S ribosomal subunit protein L6 [Candidatus Magnetomoraceae bacterium gMMP-15]
MSRVGKKPINIPDKTNITYQNNIITVKGEKGTLTRKIHSDIKLEINNGIIIVSPVSDSKKNKALQGLIRSLVSNMVTGVTKGFTRLLEINGIGYRADVQGKNSLKLALGYSNPVDFELPDGISALVDKKNNITLSGIDKELLGMTAASIRQLRPPEPYKGKGIKYAEERIQRKAGKTGTK